MSEHLESGHRRAGRSAPRDALAGRQVRRYVCLLRGVNVGGKNPLPMKELRGLFESLGYEAVETYIQSGNVLFAAHKVPDPAELETAIGRTFGLSVVVVVRSGTQLARALAANPYLGRPEDHLHLGFLAARPPASTVRGLDGGPFAPDEFAVKGSEVYLFLPDGMARTKLFGYLDRRLGGTLTVRNWRTATKLGQLAGS